MFRFFFRLTEGVYFYLVIIWKYIFFIIDLFLMIDKFVIFDKDIFLITG